MFVYFYTYYKLVAISTVTRKNIFSFLMSKNWKMWTDVCVCAWLSSCSERFISRALLWFPE